ncbi:MAG: adenylate/guanylate cyclase domain-containing protein [Bacteroidota bacterium]
MKQILFLIFLFISAIAFGQEDDAVDSVQMALALHEEGMALLQKRPLPAFDQITAFGKFRKSQNLLVAKNAELETQQKNDEQIKTLIDFYTKNADPDSLLNTTLFYPDSVFQAHPKYDTVFKNLMTIILDRQFRKARIKFFEIEGVHDASPSTLVNGANFFLDFGNYWPLEVLEIEQSLRSLEKKYSNISKKVRTEIIYTHFSNELNILKNWSTTDSLANIVQYVRQQKENSEQQLESSNKEIDNLRNIGFGIIGLLFFIGFFIWRKNNQLLKTSNQKLLEEKQRSEELLLNILPAEIAKQLKNKAAARAHKYTGVSVLFSDFKGFSNIAKDLSPEELVSELDYCFTAFDRIVEKYRLQKIKTIGDAYMCVGGLYTQGSSHVKRMVMAALEIQQFLNNLKKRRLAEDKYFFEARIGIHTGDIVAGVVGTKKFAFDIWGDTVNIAQQMEFHSEPGRVNITGETQAFINNEFNYTYRGKAVVKNMKAFDMYFVDGLMDEKK